MAKLKEELRMGIHNRFDIEVIDAETGKIKQKVQAFNVICNTYFSNASNTLINRIMYGSGNGTPSSNDTALFSYVGEKKVNTDALTVDYSQQAQGIFKLVFSCRLETTDAVGVNLSEVGLGTNYSNSSHLITHALLQDMNGNTISIAKTNTDVINIYASLYLHVNQTSALQIQRANRTFTIIEHLLKYTNPAQTALNAANGWYAGKSFNYSNQYRNRSASDIITKEKIRVSDYSSRISFRIPQDCANADGGICGIVVGKGEYGDYRNISADISIASGPYTIIQETVGIGNGITTKFKTKIDFPYNATVYVNGTRVLSGVTVNKDIKNSIVEDRSEEYRTLLLSYFQAVDPNDLGFYTCSNTITTIFSGTYLNRLYGHHGIKRVVLSNNCTLEVSNDGQTWETLASGYSIVDLPADKRIYKYYRFGGEGWGGLSDFYGDAYDGYNIIFDTPPANGDVITIDYTTDYVPKDSDHVMDVTLTLQFGEYQGA